MACYWRDKLEACYEAFPVEIEFILCNDRDQEDINEEYEESTLSNEEFYGSKIDSYNYNDFLFRWDLDTICITNYFVKLSRGLGFPLYIFIS